LTCIFLAVRLNLKEKFQCGIPCISSRNTICLSIDLERDLERQRSLSCDLDREIDRGGLTCGISSRNTICLSFDRDLERQRSLSFEFDRDLVGDPDNGSRFGCRSRDIDLSLEKVNICLGSI
jgi:hypothetical protein